MDLNNLSSNWKKLQQSLASNNLPKKKPATPNPKKRKMDSTTTAAQSAPSKSPKLSTSVSKTPERHPSNPTPTSQAISISSTNPTSAIGKYLSLDCEMVGTTSITPLAIPAHNRQTNPNASPEFSIVARATLVNYNSETIYDAYVLAPHGVTISNYRTQWSGITPQHLVPGNPKTRPKSFEVVQAEVAKLLEGRVLVGHALKNDLAVLGLSHPKRDIRDTSRYAKFRAMTAAGEGRNGKPGRVRTPSLKKLALEVLGLEIQGVETADGVVRGVGHSSAEDAGVAMMLFRREKKGFEEENVRVFGRKDVSGVVKGGGGDGVSGSAKGVSRDAPRASRTTGDSGYIPEESDEIELDSAGEEDDLNGEDGDAGVQNVADRATPRQAKKKKKKKSRTKR